MGNHETWCQSGVCSPFQPAAPHTSREVKAKRCRTPCFLHSHSDIHHQFPYPAPPPIALLSPPDPKGKLPMGARPLGSVRPIKTMRQPSQEHRGGDRGHPRALRKVGSPSFLCNRPGLEGDHLLEKVGGKWGRESLPWHVGSTAVGCDVLLDFI